jgi:hypothetical protein
VRAVQNATGFYYTATKGTDSHKLEELQDKIRDLMLSRHVDFGVIAMLAAEFRVEAGRRVFGVCLKVRGSLLFPCFLYLVDFAQAKKASRAKERRL